MRHHLHAAVAVIGTFIAAPGWTATLVEGVDEEGLTHRILIQGDLARIEGGGADDYLLLDMKTQRVHAVSHAERQIIDLNMPPPTEPTAKSRDPGVKLSFIKVGKGPDLAGHATDRYRLSAGAETCGEHYVASRTLKNPDLVRFIHAMNAYTQSQQAVLQEELADEPCAVAEVLAEDQYAKLGLPLRVTDSAGQVLHEIQRIQAQAEFPADTFTLPADYARTTPEEMMQGAMRGMPEGMEGLPMDEQSMQRMQEQMQQHLEQMRQQHAPQGGK